MKREIKFRAKNIDNNKWVCGSFVLDAKGGCRIATVDSSGKGLNFHYVIPKTVGQFTGLLDKNGREIYEGDISKIKINIQGGRSVESINKVIYDKGAFHYEDIKAKRSIPMFGVGYACEVEMIGNIFDNPKLIEL